MLVKMICPRCGASLEIDDQQEIMTCKYCGYQQANLKERVEVTHIIDRSNDPNLYITYNTTDPNVQMVTRIVSTGQKNTYINGQSMSFHLPAGQHEIILKIGKKNYSRTIVIPDDNQPVRISAGFSGRANIGIDQPNYRTVGADGRTVSGSGPIEKKKQSVFGIIGFILSLTMYLSPLGLALGILDSVRAKNDPDHAHGLGKAAIIVGGIMSVLLIVTIASCGDSKNTGTTERATAAVTEKAAETTAQSRSEAENVSKAADEIRDEVKEDVESAADELSSAVDEIAALIGFGDEDETETEVTETEVTEEETEAAGVNQEMKEFLDSYEAFVDEYAAFIDNYDSSDTEMLAEYTEMLTKLAMFEYKTEKYTDSTADMSEEDLRYYNEAMLRISNKLLALSQ